MTHDHHAHDEHDEHDHTIPTLDAAQHRQEAVALFNLVWEYLNEKSRTPQDDDQMIHAAHASRWHWSHGGDAAGPEQLAVGEWQCSRAYAVLGRGEPALHHARAALRICEESDLGDWVLAAAYEAQARASAVAGDSDAAREWLERARAATAEIEDPEDRVVIEADLATIAV